MSTAGEGVYRSRNEEGVGLGNWLGESNKKNSEFMSEHGPLVRRVFEST